MSLELFPLQSATRTYGASTFYGLQNDDFVAGFMGVNDMICTAKGSPDMSVNVNSGVAYVPFGTAAAIGQAGGLRRVYNSAQSNSGVPGGVNATDWTVTFTAADATNPRIDSVYLITRDTNLDSSGSLDAKFKVVAGTATGGATLDNRTNAGAAPANSLLIADVLISATQTTITTAKIRDRRSLSPRVTPVVFPTSGGNPAGVDHVVLQPMDGIQVSTTEYAATPLGMLGVTLAQAACAVYLPRRIVGASRIHWSYQQPATALTTTGWTLGVYDASGRQIITTATAGTAFTGALNTLTQVSAAWQGGGTQTFEAGVYWLVYGQTFGTGTASGVKALCANSGLIGSASVGGAPIAPNLFAYSATGGVTLPTTILGFTDAAATNPGTTRYGVPICSLSVG